MSSKLDSKLNSNTNQEDSSSSGRDNASDSEKRDNKKSSDTQVENSIERSNSPASVESSSDKLFSVLVIGDPHFKVGNITDTDKLLVQIMKLVKKRKPDMVVCLGDVLDRHADIHVSPLTRAIDFLYQIQNCSQLFVLIGNHDRMNNSDFLSPIHPFTALKYWDSTRIVDTVVDVEISGRHFMFLPYVPPQKFDEAFKKHISGLGDAKKYMDEEGNISDESLDNYLKDVTCIFAHQEFLNAKMGAKLSEEGDVWSETRPLVISGHIHEYDQLQSNIIYVGTPFCHNFGEKDDKRVSYYEFVTLSENEKIYNYKGDGSLIYNNKNIRVYEERIDLGIPKKIMLHMNCKQLMRYDPPKGQILKIVVTGTADEIKAINRLERIKKWDDVKIVYKTIPSEMSNPEQLQEINREKYIDRLYSRVKDNTDLRLLFEKIFRRELPNKKSRIKVRGNVPDPNKKKLSKIVKKENSDDDDENSKKEKKKDSKEDEVNSKKAKNKKNSEEDKNNSKTEKKKDSGEDENSKGEDSDEESKTEKKNNSKGEDRDEESKDKNNSKTEKKKDSEDDEVNSKKEKKKDSQDDSKDKNNKNNNKKKDSEDDSKDKNNSKKNKKKDSEDDSKDKNNSKKNKKEDKKGDKKKEDKKGDKKKGKDKKEDKNKKKDAKLVKKNNKSDRLPSNLEDREPSDSDEDDVIQEKVPVLPKKKIIIVKKSK